MITIIAALDPDNVIGSDNSLPWHYPEDLKNFKKITSGKTVIMGRKTFQSLPFVLPNRKNVVISRNFSHTGVDVYPSLEEALLRNLSLDGPFVIGGADIYQQSLRFASKMILTHIHRSHTGNKFFPHYGDEWVCTSVTEYRDFDVKEYIRDE